MAYILSSFVKRVLHGTRTELESSRFRRHALTVGVYGDCFFFIKRRKNFQRRETAFFLQRFVSKRFARKFYDVMTARALWENACAKGFCWASSICRMLLAMHSFSRLTFGFVLLAELQFSHPSTPSTSTYHLKTLRP